MESLLRRPALLYRSTGFNRAFLDDLVQRRVDLLKSHHCVASDENRVVLHPAARFGVDH